MRYLLAFLFLFTIAASAQDADPAKTQKISGTIINETTGQAISNVNVINLNRVIGAVSDSRGKFEIDAAVNDTLHLSLLGFQTLAVRVTNDWLRTKTTTLQLTEKAIALEEVIIQPYTLTGYLEVDSKLIPERENYRYSISGLSQGYEAGEYSPNAFSRVMGSIFNPADALYNFFGKKPKELKKLKQMKKDDTVRNLLETKVDRETLAAMLGIDKSEIAEILQRCNYSDAFIRNANDLQIMDAISQCYEEYKVLKRN